MTAPSIITLWSIKELPAETGVAPFKLRLGSVLELSDDQLLELSSLNRDLRLERTAEGDLIVMPPTGGDSSQRNAQLTFQLTLWSNRDGTGITFDSSGGFLLPNGAVRSPDAAWVSKERLERIPREVQAKYIPLCPEFVVELRSPTDKLETLQKKDAALHREWRCVGVVARARPRARPRVYTGENRDIGTSLDTLSGEPLLSGFALDLNEIWSL